jgi:protein SCO1/2
MIARRSFLASAAAVLAAPALAQTRDPLADRFGGPFTLTAHDGRRVSDQDFRGRFMLIYFGYTRCPDVCPVDLFTMGEALKLLGKAADNVQPLFITVDPERDTRDIIGDYAQSFHPRLLALTGSNAEVETAVRAYKVHRVKYTPANDPANYGVDHSSLTYLMGPDGKFRTLVPHNTAPDRMAAILRPYLERG